MKPIAAGPTRNEIAAPAPENQTQTGTIFETPYVVSYKSIHADIFICLDEAVRQARKFGTNWRLEVVRYLIHGILHQLGFDDASASARRKMRREENRRLRELSRRFPLSKL